MKARKEKNSIFAALYYKKLSWQNIVNLKSI